MAARLSPPRDSPRASPSKANAPNTANGRRRGAFLKMVTGGCQISVGRDSERPHERDLEGTDRDTVRQVHDRFPARQVLAEREPRNGHDVADQREYQRRGEGRAREAQPCREQESKGSPRQTEVRLVETLVRECPDGEAGHEYGQVDQPPDGLVASLLPLARRRVVVVPHGPASTANAMIRAPVGCSTASRRRRRRRSSTSGRLSARPRADVPPITKVANRKSEEYVHGSVVRTRPSLREEASNGAWCSSCGSRSGPLRAMACFAARRTSFVPG